MGVKNLKYVFKPTQPLSQKDFKYIVIDGNNLLITFLCSAKSKIIKNNFSTSLSAFSIDIITQTKLILIETLRLVYNELNKFISNYNTKEIWVVFDPSKDFDYKINIDTFDLIDYDYFNSLPHDDENNITLNVKDEEHKKRELSRNTTKDKLQAKLTAIENNEYYKTLATETNVTIEDIQQIYKQSYGYEDSTILLKLLTVLQKALINKSRQSLKLNFIDERMDYLNLQTNIDISSKLYTVYAKNEADLVIKNIAKYLTNIHNSDLLIISKDTDYKVLFSNDKNIYISDLHYDYANKIFHPYSAWREVLQFIDSGEIYNYVIRLAPIFGNDYTNGKGIINLSPSADNLNYIKALLNLPHDKLNQNTIISKYTKRLPPIKQLFSIKELDNYIKLYDMDYYDKYIKSVVIYRNYSFFNDFEITTKYYDFDITLDYIIENVLLINYSELLLFNDYMDITNIIKTMVKIKDKEKLKLRFYENGKASSHENGNDINENGKASFCVDDSYFI